MKKRLLSIAAVSLWLSSSLVHGQFIALNGGGGSVTNNLTPIFSTDSITDFYNYSPFEYGGSMTFDANTINSFLFQEDGGDLSFVTIYAENTTGTVSTAVSEVTLAGTTASFSVQDDPPGGADVYANTGGTSFSASNKWQNGLTDGFAITDVSGFSRLDQSVDPSDYGTWLLHSGNEDNPFRLSLDSDLVLRPVPEPSTIGWIVIAAIPMMMVIRRRLVRK